MKKNPRKDTVARILYQQPNEALLSVQAYLNTVGAAEVKDRKSRRKFRKVKRRIQKSLGLLGQNQQQFEIAYPIASVIKQRGKRHARSQMYRGSSK